MITDKERLQAANLLVKRFGDDAPSEAAKAASERSGAGDEEGRQSWVAIMISTKVLLSHDRG